MNSLLKAALVIGCAISGQAVSAEEHELLILRYGYYPERIYVSPGDTIKFINESPSWVRVQSNDHDDNYNNYTGNCDTNTFNGSQDGWDFSWISTGSSHTITVTACMEDEIEAPEIYRYNRYNGYNEGWIVFGSAPTGS